jgi:maltose/moltooligosaccharide transporter
MKELLASLPAKPPEASPEERESALVRNFAGALRRHQVGSPRSVAATRAMEDIVGSLAAARHYQQGAAWGGVCFSAYNGTAFIFAFALLALVKVFSARTIHRVCLVCGGGGLILAVVFPQQYLLILSMLLVGVAWASILSMPYAMLANAIPAEKMGFYMGVFNFFIVIPQILASLGLSLLMQHVLGDKPMNAVLLGGISMVVAGLCVSLVSANVDQPETPAPAA